MTAAIFLCAAMQATAQTLRLKGTLSEGDATTMELVAKAIDGTDGVVRLTANGKEFSGELPLSKIGIYYIYGKLNGGQLVMPFYSPEGKTSCKLNVDIENGFPTIGGSDDNKALSAFNRLTRDNGLFLWQHGKEEGRLKQMPTLVKSYVVSADSLLNVYKCSASTSDYLRLWAYTTAYSTRETLPQTLGVKPADLGFSPADVLPEPHERLDTPMAVLFPMAADIVASSIPNGDIGQQLSWLYANYKCDTIRSVVKKRIAERYVSTFNFADDFSGGLSKLEKAVKDYGINPRYIDDFKKRKSSVGGAAFPANIRLTDVDGKEVDFASFRGRYVYVDLWASWCGPCVREVPYLQAVEKDLNNKDVVFVSVSLDKSEKAWRDKMEALNMRGNQLLNSDGSLADALNVRGIPRFLIYDKDGKLYSSNAPRPSDPTLKPLLEKLK